MTNKDKSTIQRMLGKIECVAMAVDNPYAEPLLDAVDVIDNILDKEGGNARMTANEEKIVANALKSLEPFEVRDVVAKMQETINRQQADIERLTAFKRYFDELYGTGLDIANWHQNGELEPFDNFYNSAKEEMVGE